MDLTLPKNLDKMNWGQLYHYAIKLRSMVIRLERQVKDLEQTLECKGQIQSFQHDDSAYAIQHNITKRIYIGSSDSIKYRIQTHLSALRHGKHPIELMQKDFNDYGEDYSFYLLKADTWWSNPVEKKMQYMFQTGDPQHGYNYKENLYRDSFNGFKELTYDDIYGNGQIYRRNVVESDEVFEDET